MKKEEILEKSRKEGCKHIDEREKYFCSNAYILAAAVMVCFAGLFVIISAYKGKSIWGYSAIIFACVSVSNLYQYKFINKKFNLVAGIFASFVVIMNTVLFFTRG